MKKIFVSIAMLLTAVCFAAESPKVKIYAYPSLHYDNAHCSIYQDYMSDLSFHFFYVGKRVLDLKSSGTKFFIEIPEDIRLVEAGVMDRWKTPTGIYTSFPQQKKVINGRKYIRYELPIPTCVLQPALTKPLLGGNFGGTSNNIVTIIIKPLKQLPPKSMIYWETVGKYAYKGQFSVYPVKLDLKGLEKSRIVSHCRPNTPIFAYSKRALTEEARLFKDLKVDSIPAQTYSDKYKDIKEMWKKAGFGVFGGDNLLHLFWPTPTNADEKGYAEDRDFLTGINGVNGKYINKAAYHGRALCPQAVITPGRYPNRKLLKLGRIDALNGATWLDIDIEADIYIQCYCKECLDAFFKFSKLKPEKLAPLELVRKYPKQWYYFRNEQTRLLYQALKDDLKKKYPNLKIGANTALGGCDVDLEELKFGLCSFAEDPRLMKGTLEFVMADTLTGGLADMITVDALSRTTDVPILAVPGSSYCVGYGAGSNCARRMTSEMTGDSYGYDQRYENHRLSMLHLAASGACGFRYTINEACVAKAALEATKLLKQMENFYLDGKRADDHVKVADLTKGASAWDLDKSRIRGYIWKYHYNKYNGRVQSRTHTLNGDYSIGLYNWDPFQTKKWHVRLTDIPNGNWYLTDVVSGKRITMNGKKTWSTAELKKGFVMDIAPVDCRLLKITKKAIPASGETAIACESTTVAPYNQYAWRTGKVMTYKEFTERQLKRPLRLIKQYGNIKVNNTMKRTGIAIAAAVISTLSAADFPVTVDFKNVGKYGISAPVKDNAIVSQNNYNFGTMRLPVSGKNLLFKMKVEAKGARLGMILYNPAMKPLQNALWGYNINGKTDVEFILPASNLKTPTTLYFYSIGKVPLSISSFRIETTDKTAVVQKAAAKKVGIPTITFPFKADFNERQTGFNLGGKVENGKMVIRGKYSFGVINLPASDKPISFSMTATAKDGATLGVMLYNLNAKNLPGKVVASPMWGKGLGQADEIVNIAFPAQKAQTVLYLYNVSKKGSLTISNVEIGKIK